MRLSRLFPLTAVRFYNAHETSSIDDIAVALVCGDAEFKVEMLDFLKARCKEADSAYGRCILASL